MKWNYSVKVQVPQKSTGVNIFDYFPRLKMIARSCFHRFSMLTCIHGAAQLDEALEGEVGDVRGPPHPGLGVEALLVAPPSARLLPVGLLLLVLHQLPQLHVPLKAQRGHSGEHRLT